MLERVHHRTIVVDHGVHDPVEQPDRPFRQQPVVTVAQLAQVRDRRGFAVVHRDQIRGAEEEVDVAGGERLLALAHVDAVQHDVEIARIGLDLGELDALRASSTESGWKWKTSARIRTSSSVGAARSTQTVVVDDGSSHAGSTRSARCTAPFSRTKIVISRVSSRSLRRYLPSAACAAASRATGTRYGEQLT